VVKLPGMQDAGTRSEQLEGCPVTICRGTASENRTLRAEERERERERESLKLELRMGYYGTLYRPEQVRGAENGAERSEN